MESPIPHLQVTVCLELSLHPQTLSKGTPLSDQPQPSQARQASAWDPLPSVLLLAQPLRAVRGTHPVPPALLEGLSVPLLFLQTRDPCGQLGHPNFCPASARFRLTDFLIVQSPMHFPSFLEAPPHALFLVPQGPGSAWPLCSLASSLVTLHPSYPSGPQPGLGQAQQPH